MDLAHQLDQVGDVVQQRNSLLDVMAMTILQVEEYLTFCYVGLSAEVVVADPVFKHYHLLYHKHAEKWRICVRGPDFERPWSECKQEIKLLTFRAICNLLEALEQAVSVQVKKAETLKPLMEEIRAAIGK